MLTATVQSRFPFAGVMREPGEVLDGDTLSKASRQVIDAMVAQKLLLIDSGELGGGDPAMGGKLAHLQARYDALQGRVTRIEADADEKVGELRAALPAAVEAAVAKAMEAFTSPEVTVNVAALGITAEDVSRIADQAVQRGANRKGAR